LTFFEVLPKIIRRPSAHFPILETLMNEEAIALARVLRKDSRYAPDAYFFVREALGYAADNLALRECNCGEDCRREAGSSPEEPVGEIPTAADFSGRSEFGPEDGQAESSSGQPNHVTGQQLCAAVRQFALAQFGLMAMTVLNSWGIYCTGDIGEIVYNLIRVGVLKKSPRDRRSHFDEVFDFEEAFNSEEAIAAAFPPKMASIR
jgi:uncharacterized repeat protein (TIGR04138 family)